MREEALERCQQAIGIRFKDVALLESALTHASIANSRLESNERLEFLGDSILGMVVCRYLYDHYPDYLEGELTKIKSAVVSGKTCAKISEDLGMADRALNNKKIEMVWDSEVADVIGDDVITGVKIQNNKTNEASDLAVNGLFIAIGHTPITGFLNGQLDTDDKGYLVLDDQYRSTTKIEGCFAAGDVVDSTYRQAITAAGMGCKAAIDAERWLADQGIE